LKSTYKLQSKTNSEDRTIPNHCENTLNIGPVTETQAQRILKACEANQLAEEFFPAPDWASTPNEDGLLPSPRYKARVPRRLFWTGYIPYSQAPIFPDGSSDQRWYGWANTAWGTKWGAYDCDATYDPDAESVTIFFQTAWSPLSDEYFEHLSGAMPNAEIQCFFIEPGCDFYGMTYATKGSSATRVEDIDSLRSVWLSQNYTEEQINNEDLEEEISEAWYEVNYDKCADSADRILADLEAEFKTTTHELKGRALVDVVRKIRENILINTWETTDVVKAMIFAGYVSKDLANSPDGLRKEKALEKALNKFTNALTSTHEYIDAHIKSCRPTTT